MLNTIILHTMVLNTIARFGFIDLFSFSWFVLFLCSHFDLNVIVPLVICLLSFLSTGPSTVVYVLLFVNGLIYNLFLVPSIFILSSIEKLWTFLKNFFSAEYILFSSSCVDTQVLISFSNDRATIKLYIAISYFIFKNSVPCIVPYIVLNSFNLSSMSFNKTYIQSFKFDISSKILFPKAILDFIGKF